MAMLPSIDPEYPFPYSYTYTFQGLPWNQRALNLIGSGKVFNEYLGKGPLNAQNDRMVVMLAQSAIVDIEITIKDLKQKSFHEAIGYIWRETACLLDSPRQKDAVKLGLWRALLRLTFPSSELDLLAIRKWPLWLLKAYIPGTGEIISVEFNAEDKDMAFNMIVDAYMEAEGSNSHWAVMDVALVRPEFEPLLFDFLTFTGPIMDGGVMIPVEVPPECKYTHDGWVNINTVEYKPWEHENYQNSYHT